MATYGIPPGASPRVNLTVNLTKAMNAGVQMVQDPTIALRGAVGVAAAAIALPALIIDPITGAITYPANFTAGLYNSVTSAISNVGSAVSQLGTHISDHLTNIGNRLGLGESAVGTSQTLNKTSNPCDMFKNFFNSIMGLGKELLAMVLDVVNDLANIVNAVLGAIGAAVEAAIAALNMVLAQVQAAINNVLNMIANELAAMADWIQRMINYAKASLLSLFNDIFSCSHGVLGQILTPAANAIFGPGP